MVPRTIFSHTKNSKNSSKNQNTNRKITSFSSEFLCLDTNSAISEFNSQFQFNSKPDSKIFHKMNSNSQLKFNFKTIQIAFHRKIQTSIKTKFISQIDTVKHRILSTYLNNIFRVQKIFVIQDRKQEEKGVWVTERISSFSPVCYD